MIGGRDAVGFSKRVVDGQIAKLRVENGKAHRRGTEITCEQFFLLAENVCVREVNRFAGVELARFIRHGDEPPPKNRFAGGRKNREETEQLPHKRMWARPAFETLSSVARLRGTPLPPRRLPLKRPASSSFAPEPRLL